MLKALTRLFTDNRRRHQRLRRKYDTLVRDEGWREVFHGKTLDISRGGARIMGFPKGRGVLDGQKVTIEFLIIPKDITQVAQRAPVPGRVVRVMEREDEFLLAVKFDESLPGE
jgi:hypothetical protein